MLRFGNKTVPLFSENSTKLSVDSFYEAVRKLPEINADLGKKANLLDGTCIVFPLR